MYAVPALLAADASSIDADCGIACSRIEAWLNDELSLPFEDGAWAYSCEGGVCRVSATPLAPRLLSRSRAVGALALERTRLVAKGDREALVQFDRLFTLRFISAGG